MKQPPECGSTNEMLWFMNKHIKKRDYMSDWPRHRIEASLLFLPKILIESSATQLVHMNSNQTIYHSKFPPTISQVMAFDTAPSGYVDKDALRTQFAAAMSGMYRSEVPLYGDLIDIVREINEAMLGGANTKAQPSNVTGIHANIERLTQERHGAIRLGTPYELRTMKRVFEVLGMHPIGYYDLSIAGLPMHATCFRPLQVSSLEINPFRVFTTLLRPELLASEEARQLSLELLEKRNIFSNVLLSMLDVADIQGGRLKKEQGETFIKEAISTFSWQPVAAATFDQYQLLKAEHPILADIACFQSAHINHLTPRTLDISAVHSAMKKAGMAAKDAIEGPPGRECPILLHQTSFLALEEAVSFRNMKAHGSQKAMIEAGHKARFGEIEERGAAVTPKGRALLVSHLCLIWPTSSPSTPPS